MILLELTETTCPFFLTSASARVLSSLVFKEYTTGLMHGGRQEAIDRLKTLRSGLTGPK